MSIFYKLRYCKYYGKILFSNWTQSKESYSQHGEDILVESLFPNGVRSFIDIGANDGVLFSNTYKFAKNGARGLCLEPSTTAFKKLTLNHIFNRKVVCLHTAISNKNGRIQLEEDGYESTLSKVIKKKTPKTIEVPCYTMKKILSKYPHFSEVDLVSIDVEGHEREVLDGMPSTDFYAKLLIIESDKSEIEELTKLRFFNDYRPLISNGINTFFTNNSYKSPNIKVLPKEFNFC